MSMIKLEKWPYESWLNLASISWIKTDRRIENVGKFNPPWYGHRLNLVAIGIAYNSDAFISI